MASQYISFTFAQPSPQLQCGLFSTHIHNFSPLCIENTTLIKYRQCMWFTRRFTTCLLNFTPIYKMNTTLIKQYSTASVCSLQGCLRPIYTTLLPQTRWILPWLNNTILLVYVAYQGVYYPFTQLYSHLQDEYYPD